MSLVFYGFVIMTDINQSSLPKDLKLPHLPDMLFAKNRLVLQRQQTEEGEEPIRMELDPFEALKRVNPTEDLVHVALAKEWMEARSVPLFAVSISITATLRYVSSRPRL